MVVGIGHRDGWAAPGKVEGASKVEEAIADHLRLDAVGRKAPEGLVLGIFFVFSRLGGRRVEHVGVGSDNQFVEVAEAIPFFHQLNGQSVKQFGMGGRRAFSAKIEQGGDKGLAKMAIPDVVDDHPGSEGIIWVGDPAGQGSTATGTGGGVEFRFAFGGLYIRFGRFGRSGEGGEFVTRSFGRFFSLVQVFLSRMNCRFLGGALHG